MGKRKSFEETFEALEFVSHQDGETKLTYPIIETHCHLDYLKSLPQSEIIEKSFSIGIEKIITITVNPSNLQTVLDIARVNENIFCTQGIHPHDAKEYNDEVGNIIKSNAKDKNVKAIGEIGLDYYYEHSPRDKQRQAFKQQLEIAVELDLPVVIHSRDADDDTLEILRDYAPKLLRKGVIHSYTSGIELAQFAIDSDFKLGFNGIISFNAAENVREILKMTPAKNILLETDAPFLTPVPHRGKENTPYYLPFVASKLLEVKEMQASELLPVILKNSKELFDI